MKIIVAGSNTNNAEGFCLKHGLMKLYSMRNELRLIDAWDDDNLLMVDSGAHSWNKVHDGVGMKSNAKLEPAEIFIEKYFDYIKANRDKKVVWVELDVYNDLSMSVIDEFYDKVMKLDIAGKFIRVYHHYLDPKEGDYSTLNKWVEQGQDYIGLGADNIENFGDIFALTKNKVRYHGFALTRLPLVEKYPFFSVDSTAPLSTVIFGRYTKPIMRYKGRVDVMKDRSTEAFHGDYERLENAIIETKICEDYLTELWKKRGVTWQDLKF